MRRLAIPRRSPRLAAAPPPGGPPASAIRAEEPRFGDLILVDDEILAQRGQRAGSACGGEKLGCTLEVITIGQHGKTRCSASFVTASDRGRIEDRPQNAPARARLLDLS